ncbi:hypothetical protein [Natrinema versiforme]|uniref:Uncharacterized protein n=1 Tax=Natrinema versiforme TaxID=88724 RepID=A0A4P8WQK5_9EURY|nr:hypothetical protein [Natrinema versiforme]QCS44461.1 hypothetical protein FEJ81_19160 [Natrinema versiforme]
MKLGGNMRSVTSASFTIGSCPRMSRLRLILPSEGQYESDEELLWQQVAGPDVEALKRGETYYAPQVDVENGVHTLQFEETTPQYDSTKHLTVPDVSEVPLNISFTIKDTEGTVLKEVDRTIEEKDNDRKVPVATELGTYLVEVTVEGWGTVTESVTLEYTTHQVLLNTQENDEAESSFSVSITQNPATTPAKCQW